MPYASDKQKRLMQAVAHNPAFAKKAGIPQSVGRKFEAHKAELKGLAIGNLKAEHTFSVGRGTTRCSSYTDIHTRKCAAIFRRSNFSCYLPALGQYGAKTAQY